LAREVILPNNWEPRAYQLPAWTALENGIKRALLVWHRRAGKDDVCLHWAATQVMQRVGNYWHMLPEYAQARKSVWNAVNPHTGKRRVDEAFPPEIRKRTVDNEMFIEFLNGSTWQLVGSDNFNALVGSPPIGVTASEWALANPSAWAYLSPILRENGGWAVFITTPRGKNHVHKMAKGFKDDPRWFVQTLSINDTKALSEAEQAEALQEYIITYGEDHGRALYEQEYEVSFDAALLGAYYGAEFRNIEALGRICEVPYQPELPVFVAMDIGRTDDTSMWFFQVLPGEIHVINFHTSNGHDVDWYCDLLDGKGYNYAKLGEKPFLWLPHDAKAKTFISKGKSAQEQFLERGYASLIVPQLSVQDGIQATRKMLKRCYFDEKKTEVGVEAMKMYQREWDDDKKIFKDKPLHNWASNPADGARYMAIAWQELVPEPKPEPPIFPVAGINGRIVTEPLDTLWATAPKRSGRL
jgi:phage terminase large subunit